MLVGRPEGTRSLGRIRSVRDDNIKMQPLGNMICECEMDSSGSGERPVAS
jgi:hypothetical protein